jgi:S1-C subfamily serine protease/photosystem II stability/assembly factor-like uncharacterized protein
MAFPNPLHLHLPLRTTVCLAAIAAAIVGQTTMRAQEQPPPQVQPQAQPPALAQPVEPSRDQRISEIERRLAELLKEVQALRTSGGTPSAAPAGQTTTSVQLALPESWLKTLQWRPIGPANMGGRIVDLAVSSSDPSTFWVATASGGLLKTTNNGVTFEHQFDREATVSIGAVAVAPSDHNIVWVGTGENNPRNSVSYGDGVYKSTDGGKTWKNMGLKKSFQIGRIVIHPQDPNTVYVGALGRLYGPNEERGVFKTTDGGQNWERVLFVDDKTGVIDLIMHPTDPQTLIAATWERQRDGFDSWPGNEVPKPDGYDGYDPIKKWGPGSGLHKTTDGGKSWRKLTAGLPTSNMGRIGLDWYRKDPSIVYAVIDCENIGKGPQPLPVSFGAVGQDIDGKARVVQVIPNSSAARAGIQAGDTIRGIGDKTIGAFDEILDELRTKKPGDKITLKIARGEEQKDLELALAGRPGSGGIVAAGNVWLGALAENREGKVTLTRVLADGPAAKAGLSNGDVIEAVEDQPMDDFDRLIESLRDKKAGDKLNVRYVRRDETKDAQVTIEERPQFAGFGGGGGGGFGGRQQQSGVYLGILGEDSDDGVRLTRVTEDGPAEKAGIETGDIVKLVDDKPLANYEALIEQIRQRKEGDKVKLTVVRGNETKEFTVTLENRPGGPSRTRPYAASLGGQAANVQDQQGAKGYEYGGIYRSTDGGETWTRVNSLHSRPMYFSVIKVDPNDDRFVYLLGVSQYRSTNGGLTFDGDFGRGVHADGHALWIDPRDGRHMIIGVDGGTYVTYDRGANWDHLNHTAIGQFYHVAIAPKEPYHVVGGLQDNGTWLGPSLSKNGNGPINEDWISVGGGDGFMCRVDPDDPDLIYFTSQDGALARRNLRTGERASIRPQRPRGAPPYRFNWNTPFILSSHNSRIYYCAGNYVFRSLNRGENLQAISPEITLTKRGSATALAESPRNANVLYVGTDDGALWVTRDGGREWKNITANLGLPAPRWVATIEASRYEEGRVYVALDGHRSDDDEPYVFVSEDFGQTWRSIRANLPWGSTRCLREDTQNPDLLFVGTEFGAWCSLDRGNYWNKLNTNLPTVAVHEFAIHPDNGEIVLATHGRSLWIGDISALRQIKAENLSDKIALYRPSATIRWMNEPSRGRTNRRFTGANPPNGAQLYYSLPKKVEKIAMRVVDVEGNTVRELRVPSEPGLHRVAWDLLRAAPRPAGAVGPGPSQRPPSGARQQTAGGQAQPQGTGAPPARQAPPDSPPVAQAQPPAAPADQAGQTGQRRGPGGQEPGQRAGRGGGPGRGGGGGVRPVPPGVYRVLLVVDGQEFSQTITVARDPTAPPDAVADADQEPIPDEEAELEELRLSEID